MTGAGVGMREKISAHSIAAFRTAPRTGEDLDSQGFSPIRTRRVVYTRVSSGRRRLRKTGVVFSEEDLYQGSASAMPPRSITGDRRLQPLALGRNRRSR